MYLPLSICTHSTFTSFRAKSTSTLRRIWAEEQVLCSWADAKNLASGIFVNGGVLEQFKLRICDAAPLRHLHVALDPLAGILYRLVKFGLIFFLSFSFVARPSRRSTLHRLSTQRVYLRFRSFAQKSTVPSLGSRRRMLRMSVSSASVCWLE